jgi:hypothetical protein
MDPADAAEAISDAAEEGGVADKRAERLRDAAAIAIAVMAAILAIGGLGGGNATDDMVANNIQRSDTWNFYQAKNARQTQYELAADALRLRLATPTLSPAERTLATTQLAHYEATIKRYDSEPDPKAPGDPTKGEGKAQLKARAQSFEAAFDRASDQDGNFDYAETALQLALVLGSVSILAKSQPMLIGALVLGTIGTILTANGFLLLFPLPF